MHTFTTFHHDPTTSFSFSKMYWVKRGFFWGGTIYFAARARAGGHNFFCCSGGVRVFFAFWAGRGHPFFAVWTRDLLLALLFGRWCVFCCFLGGVRVFLLLGRGTEVHSLTGLLGLASGGPATKRTKQCRNERLPSPSKEAHVQGHTPRKRVR